MARTVGSTAEETRQRIIDTATELFVERGYAGTSVRDIAERLGMTTGSLYYHFASKDALLYALVAPLFDAMARFVDAARDSGSVSPTFVRELVDLLDAHAPMVRSLSTDPAVTRTKLEERDGFACFAELERIMSGSKDEAATLRGRCALGVVVTGVLGPPRPEPRDADGRLATRRPLTEAERAFVTSAALAVLAVPVPTR
jgi:AcrR family transcriptional regulator